MTYFLYNSLWQITLWQVYLWEAHRTYVHQLHIEWYTFNFFISKHVIKIERETRRIQFKKKYLLTSTCQCSSQQYSIHVYLYLPKSIDSSQLVETNGWLPSLQNIRIRESITLVLLSQCTPDILKIIRSISGFGRETIVESLEKRLSQSKSYVFTIYFIIFQSFANFLRLNFNVTAWKGFVNIWLFVLLLTS